MKIKEFEADMFEVKLEFVARSHYDHDYIVHFHEHPCYELIYYVNGQGYTKIGETLYDFFVDSYILIPPNELHRETGNSGVEVLYIGFTLLDGFITLERGCYTHVADKIYSLLSQIEIEMDDKKIYYENIVGALLQQLVVTMCRSSQRQLAESDNKTLNAIINYINLNFMKKISAKDVAESVGYSYDYFRHFFRKHMDITAKDYIQQKKLEYAAKLLLQKKYSQKEISSICGFASISHFNMVFKKEYQLTPKQFVKAHLNTEHVELRHYPFPDQQGTNRLK